MYREFAPPPSLVDRVACLWVRAPGVAGDVRVVPDACADVVWRRGTGVTVAGPDTSAKVVATGADDVLVGLRFRPGAGGGGLGVPLEALRDLRVDVRDIDRAYAVAPDADPDAVLRAFLVAAAARRGDALVQAAVGPVAGGAAVREVAARLAVSERQLRRRFDAAVGYGPKTLQRIARFRRFTAAVDRGERHLASLALAAGYADQAHLTRECTRLAGLPPAAFMRARGAGRPGAGTGARRTR